MANPVNPVLVITVSEKGNQPATVPELPNNQPHQPLKQGHAGDHTGQVEGTGGEDHS